MPDDTETAATRGVPDFPADTRTLVFRAADFAANEEKGCRLSLSNPHHSVLHVRLTSRASWLQVTPSEVALGPGERQAVVVRVAVDDAGAAVQAGAAPVAPVQIVFQRLFPGSRGMAPSPMGTGMVYVRLPYVTCPSCHRALEDAPSEASPELCPFCFERLRSCPVCGAPNSWLARRCILDPAHSVRAALDWPTVGGGPDHAGNRTPSEWERASLALSRRWSFPSVPPSSRDAALSWSAPAAAYGLAAAAAATPQGDAHLYAFDAAKGSPLWEPYPLPDPVYPERGGAALAGGRLFAATVDGVCVCVDALRGTRLWETQLDGRVYGAVVPVSDDGPLLVPAATSDGAGCLYILEGASGKVLHRVPLNGPPDSAPAAADDVAFAHEDTGTLTAIDIARGRGRWQVACGASFDAAPVVRDKKVFSATRAGTVLCHDAATGAEEWRVAVTSAPFGGTPAHDGALLYLPADDGVHLVSSQGRAVRRYGVTRPVRAAPVVVGGTLFFGATDGRMYGVDAGRSLQTLYETGVGSQIVASPALADGSLFVAATNGVLYTLSVG